MGVNQSPEQQAGIKVKNRRIELGMSQEAVAEEMRRLGHSWIKRRLRRLRLPADHSDSTS